MVDRSPVVHLYQRQQDQERREAEARYQAKMGRIERLRSDIRAMDEERKKIQAMMARVRPPPGAFDQPTPGPGEYAVADAEAKLKTGPGVRMGAAPQKVKRIAPEAPGPGAYGNPVNAIRSSKGAKLPPRTLPHAGSTAHSSHAATPHGSSANSPARSHSALAGRLPSIGKQQPGRAATSMAGRQPAARTATSVERPADLRDEDFVTDDEFEDA
jgi:hypothetical protein